MMIFHEQMLSQNMISILNDITVIMVCHMIEQVNTSSTLSTETEVPRYTFVSRNRGARDVHKMTAAAFAQLVQSRRGKDWMGDPTFTLQEHFNGGTMVHPYYDYDAKYKQPFATDEDREKEENVRLADFRGIVTKLYPNIEDIVYAKRHGVIGSAGQDTKGKGNGKDPEGKGKAKPEAKPDEYVYKISYRAWVQGVKLKAADIPRYVRGILGLAAKAVHPYLDLSVYEDLEQLLGVIYGCKDIDVVKRYLVPLDKTEPLTKYLAQNVSEGDTLITLPGESQFGSNLDRDWEPSHSYPVSACPACSLGSTMVYHV